METINEFATKYAQDKYLPVQTYNAVKAGANYVHEKKHTENQNCYAIKKQSHKKLI